MPKPSQPLIRVIAIDGPVASGKTVVGRELAARLGWRMLDTGIMYRALTWYALREGIELEDHVKLAETARAVTIEIGAPPS
ncbi:MAG: (d)CMP kinase, partial [Chloroflexi bacterium]|nr:(d)CMP kinase [Chloroflexota bacterium]